MHGEAFWSIGWKTNCEPSSEKCIVSFGLLTGRKMLNKISLFFLPCSKYRHIVKCDLKDHLGPSLPAALTL